jgi:hypothetical protein
MSLRFRLALKFFPLIVLEACNSTDPTHEEIRRESAESNALIDAVNRRIEDTAHDTNLVGAPLPPLAGVDVPAPSSKTTEAEHDHHPQ